MKNIMVACGIGLVGALAAQAVEFGQSPSQVQAELGAPTGQLLSGARLLFTYDRGEVEFRSNQVIRCELVSPEEAERRRLALAEDRARQMDWATAQVEARVARGQAALDAARADPALGLRSASEQIAFWRSFRQQYPEVPVEQEYAAALRRREIEELEQRAAIAESQRMAQLESRVAAAEERARDAERRSLHRTYPYDGFYGYPYPVTYYPVRVIRSDCRPRVCAPTPPPCVRPGLSVSFHGGSTVVRGHTSLVRN
jgi:hypothetical protein